MKFLKPSFATAVVSTLFAVFSAGAMAMPVPADSFDSIVAAKMLYGSQVAIHLGSMSAQQSRRSDVQQFAQESVKKTTEATDILKDIAARNALNIDANWVQSPQDQADKDAIEAEATRLAGLSGDQFDSAFLESSIKGMTSCLSYLVKVEPDVQSVELRAHIIGRIIREQKVLVDLKQLAAVTPGTAG